MKRLLLSLALISGSAEAKDTGINAPLLAEHCEVDLPASKIAKVAEQTASDVAAAMDVTADDSEAYEKKNAMEYLSRINAIPYAKMQSDFARLQRTTILEDRASISSARKELKTIEAEIAKANKLLAVHTDLNSGGSYDIAYFTPDPQDVMEADLDKAFSAANKKGVNCGENVQAYVLSNKRFPGAGEVVETLMEVANAGDAEAILPEVASFDEVGNASDLKTEKAKFVRESAEVQKVLKLSESIALRAETLIRTKYINPNK